MGEDITGSDQEPGEAPTEEIIEKNAVDNFKQNVENNPLLQKHHLILQDSRISSLLKVFFMVALIFSVLFICYLAYNDKFKPEFSAPVTINNTCEKQICNNSCPQCPSFPNIPACPTISPIIKIYTNQS
jgi:hypothetical protein